MEFAEVVVVKNFHGFQDFWGDEITYKRALFAIDQHCKTLSILFNLIKSSFRSVIVFLGVITKQVQSQYELKNV